jgi:glycogen operon protein
VNLSHPRVLQMVADSLRYWAQEMRVDGFRFDLATIPGARTVRLRRGRRDSSMPAGRIPILSQVKLIAEPWDIGPGGYQVGHFPPGWAEWNDKFRDTVRSVLEGRRGSCPISPSGSPARAISSNRRGRKPGHRSTS